MEYVNHGYYPCDDYPPLAAQNFRCVGCNRLCCVCFATEPFDNESEYRVIHPTLCDDCGLGRAGQGT